MHSYSPFIMTVAVNFWSPVGDSFRCFKGLPLFKATIRCAVTLKKAKLFPFWCRCATIIRKKRVVPFETLPFGSNRDA